MDVKLGEQETEELSSSGDLLLRLTAAKFSEERAYIPREIEPELSLGLSLGGCFAVKPRETRLMRSSSNATLSAFSNGLENPRLLVPLVRTCSLPAEADEESRKRKEIQSLERLEAKRKRKEKRSSSVPEIGAPDEEPDRSEELPWSSSDFDGRSLEGSILSSLSNSSTLNLLPDTSHKAVAADPLPPQLRSLNSLKKDDVALKRVTDNLNRPKDAGRNIMDEMPCVSVKGVGPHVRRIEGFLYRYRQGEEVKIVCVCHGNFFTPAEFIKHAGGGDVTHPLRHIVINPSPSIYY